MNTLISMVCLVPELVNSMRICAVGLGESVIVLKACPVMTRAIVVGVSRWCCVQKAKTMMRIPQKAEKATTKMNLVAAAKR